MLLTVREVADLTGRERRSAQCRALDAMGVGHARRNRTHLIDAPQESPAGCPIRSGSWAAIRPSERAMGFCGYWTGKSPHHCTNDQRNYA